MNRFPFSFILSVLIFTLSIPLARAAEVSPEVKEAGRLAITCSQKKKHQCTIDNYRKVLDANILNDDLVNQVKSIQIQSLILLMSENGLDMPAQKYADYCDYGVKLVEETGRQKWKNGTMIYIQCMIGHHDLGNYKRKQELIRHAKNSMRASGEWPEHEKGLSNSDVQLTIDWANQAINALR